MAKIKEIKEALNNSGVETTDLTNKEIKELYENIVQTINQAEPVLDKGLVPTEETTEMSEVDNRPKITDKGWTDYALSLFDDRELDNGMPKTDALRRVAELILGPFNSYTEVVQFPTIDNAGRATVVVNLEFINQSKQRFCGAADVFSGNTAREYAVHAVATAETRAEGRALRKALRLTKILSAEELQNADVDEPNGSDKRIVTTMLNSLRVMCDRVGVDLTKLSLKLGYEINVPEDLTHKQGLDISSQLSKFQRKVEEIPEEVKR